MEKIADIPPATFESVWTSLQETDRMLVVINDAHLKVF